MKRVKLASLALLCLALAAGPAWGELYLEFYLGNNFTVTSANPIDFNVNPAFRGPVRSTPEYPRTFCSNVSGGGKVGTWFVKEGALGFDYPAWMKYFGVYLDFNYHMLQYYPGEGSRRLEIAPWYPPFYQHYKFLGKGSVASLGLMVACRYGFFPQEEIPFGRLQPYVAVGPALMIVSLRPTLMIQPGGGPEEFFPTTVTYNPIKYSGSWKSTLTVGLATEVGLRYMIRRFLSAELSFKYRYARPKLTIDIPIYGLDHELIYKPQLHLFSVQMGVAYHF